MPWHRYTDLNAEALGDAIAAQDNWLPSGTVVTTGSNVLIALLIQFCALGGRVVTVKPKLCSVCAGRESTCLPLTSPQFARV